MLDEIAGLIVPESACLAVVEAVVGLAEGQCLAEVAILKQALADETAKAAALFRELQRLEEAELEARKAAELRREVAQAEESRRERELFNAELRRALARVEEAERGRAAADEELRMLIRVEAAHHHRAQDRG